MLSVLITIKDRQEYLFRQVEFLSRELITLDIPWEVIIFDDGSEVPLVLGDAPAEFKLIGGGKNNGLIEARNILARNVSEKSEFLFFLDDDIFIHNLVAYIDDAVKEIDSGYSCVSAPYINLPTFKYESLSTFKHFYDVRRCDDDVVYFFGGTSIFKKDDFFLLRGLEGAYYIYLEEEDMALRMYVRGLRNKIMYGGNYIAIHDQAPGKNYFDRRVYLLSNRCVYHYKFVGSNLFLGLFNSLYFMAYLVKYRSFGLLRLALARYRLVRSEVVRQPVSLSLFARFLVKRYFNF